MNTKETAICLEFMQKTVYDMVKELSSQYVGHKTIDVNGDEYTVISVYLNSTGKLCCMIDYNYVDGGVYETLFEWIN